MTRWQEAVVRALLRGGQEGVTQSALYNIVSHSVRHEKFMDYLESLRAEHAVQKFYVDRSTYWRATSELLSVV